MIIHQSWKNDQVPDKFKDWPVSWKQNNKDWTYQLWTDDSNKALVEEVFPWLMPVYKKLARNVMRADLSRYVYMYHYGGLYADLDMECLQPISGLINRFPTSHLFVGEMSLNKTYEHNIPNAFMLSKPGHPVWLWIIRLVMNRLDSGHAEFVTGPMVMKDGIDAYMKFGVAGPDRVDGIKILPPAFIYPVDWHIESFHTSNCSGGDTATFSPDLCKKTYEDIWKARIRQFCNNILDSFLGVNKLNCT